VLGLVELKRERKGAAYGFPMREGREGWGVERGKKVKLENQIYS